MGPVRNLDCVLPFHHEWNVRLFLMMYGCRDGTSMLRSESSEALGLDGTVGVGRLKGRSLRKPIRNDRHQSENQGTVQLDTMRDTFNHSFRVPRAHCKD